MSEELAAFLKQYADSVLVSFWEDDVQDSHSVEQLLNDIERFRHVPMLHLRLPEYRAWAHAHGVHGTPALVAYYRHQPLFRLIGRTTSAELLRRLRNSGL